MFVVLFLYKFDTTVHDTIPNYVSTESGLL